MSFSSPPPTQHSRYFDNGSPNRCYHCGQSFRGFAIRNSETNCYFCCDSCLEAAQFGSLAERRHKEAVGKSNSE